MTNYVLVHGADHDGTVWQDVAKLLKGKNHQVFCPTMTSITEASLEQNISEILAVIEKHKLKNIILCAHSYAAMVITGVFDKIPTKIASLVFIDTAIPKSGESLYGMLKKQGFDYHKLGLTADRACLDPLVFDEKRFLAKQPKVYIHCLESEFIAVLKPIFDNEVLAKAKQNNWLSFCLHTSHLCMLTKPQEVAIILNGISNT